MNGDDDMFTTAKQWDDYSSQSAWDNMIKRAEKAEAELTSARSAAGIDAGMPLDEWIKAEIEDHADMIRKRDEWKEAHSDACRLLDTVQEQRDEARKQRDAAWSEQLEVRRLIEADPEESTIDEVTRKLYRLSKDLRDAEKERDELKDIVRGLSKRLSEVTP